MSTTRPPGWVADLPLRIAVGLVLIALALGALALGGAAFWVLVCVASILMMGEWAGLAGVGEKHKRIGMYALCVPLAILAPDPIAAGPGFLVIGLIAGTAFFVAAATRNGRMGLGVVYVAVPALALVFLRDRPDGMMLALWALATVWATDIGAYFAGRLIGGPKLAPAVSPNKTWAGLIGGMAAALALGLIFHQGWGLALPLALASPVLAVIAQLGDLYESALKRRAGVKDSGTLLPGHGGVLDRLDGVVTAAPCAALLLILLGVA
ncbi:MAG: phosphatidate cytidylyltransferase [Sphingomonas sp. SCN 67-18]|uniref:phosphatidate cytidylyltransferase n=1 Tax=uncultured Sphingomonas sp. TaxID=158754 RepID=UPI00086E3DDE|nr:phosphatidate cytidylyltransferase [Sphingomonas sp. SCN 67-18]ODU20909.1 MAG: phosphatidate cytidylyltransferase [Sphingomonas sp. SCN 67-18]